MWQLKLKNTQKQIDEFSDFVWSFLSANFIHLKTRRPPLYLFLSKESKGSLSQRTENEKEFIHEIQFGRGGAVLHRRPLLGYVSHWTQVPEETAHLYSLSLQKTSLDDLEDSRSMHNIAVLHESFGTFVQSLMLPKSAPKQQKTNDPLWDSIHQKGLGFGQKLARAFFDQQIKSTEIKKLLKFQWHRDLKTSQVALEYLRALTRQSQ